MARRARARSVIVEVTLRARPCTRSGPPRLCAPSPTTLTQVRGRGWLLLDQEHPEQLGDTRATLWEIHPDRLG